MSSQTTPRFIRASRIPMVYGVSRRTVFRREKFDPAFPKAKRLSSRLVMFSVEELDSYFTRKEAVQ